LTESKLHGILIIDMNANQIIQRLIDNNYESYFIGGCVRDMLLNLKAKDKDIVTKARPQQVIELFRDCNVKLVGKSFGVVIVNNVEIATFRKDKYFGLNDKDVNITFADTLREDVERRDFTINAIALDIDKNAIIDHFRGSEDLKNKIIRFVGNPKDRIFEDPNRILRSARFLAKINGIYDPTTLNALIKYAHFIKNYVAPERIRLEILKAMELDQPSLFFKALQSIGALQYIFPHLKDAQDFYHGTYHLEDVFEHNMICGDSLHSKNKLLRLTGYLHDIGKVVSYQDEKETCKRSFIGHEETGSQWILDNLTNVLKFSIDETKYIANLVKFHMRGIKQSGPKAIRKLIKELNEAGLSYQDLIRLKIADRKANLKKNNYSFKDIKGILKKYRKELNREKEQPFLKLAINGNDIMNITKLKPGENIGMIKNHLAQKILDNPELNNVCDLANLTKEFYKTIKKK